MSRAVLPLGIHATGERRAVLADPGKTTNEIAPLLGLRSDSVRRLLHSAYEKLGVENRVAATLRAVELAREILDNDHWAKAHVLLRTRTRW